MAVILKGAEVTAAMNEKLIAEAAGLKAKGIVPTLAIVRVGERGDDISYERGAMKRCEKIGVAVRQFLLPADASQEELLKAIHEVNQDTAIHGCLLFRPLPKHIDDETIRQALNPAKDMDGITDGSLAGVFAGTNQGYPPCTAQACIEILDHFGYELTGKRAAVIGRSLVIGRPVAMMLMQRSATVTICHTRTADLPAVCRNADIVIAAAGHAGVVDGSYFAPGQVVIDVGINVGPDGKLCGDVKWEEAEPIVAAITPVPGGVGTVTTSVLVKHVIDAAKKAAGQRAVGGAQ